MLRLHVTNQQPMTHSSRPSAGLFFFIFLIRAVATRGRSLCLNGNKFFSPEVTIYLILVTLMYILWLETDEYQRNCLSYPCGDRPMINLREQST